MTISGTAFERAKRMLDDGTAATHQLLRPSYPRTMPLDHIMMNPAIDVATLGFRRQALRTQRTGPTHRASAGVTDLLLACLIKLQCTHAGQFASRRTAVN